MHDSSMTMLRPMQRECHRAGFISVAAILACAVLPSTTLDMESAELP
jgi:hypothetical protein